MTHRGTIIQFGSGKPGEENSAQFERQMLAEFGVDRPSIVFIPFHKLAPGENDWTRFRELHGRTASRIELLELVPFEPQPEPERLLQKLQAADLIVLGSGMVEPYMAAILASGLDRTFARLHRGGKIFIGYSAGSISLGTEFRWPLQGVEILEMLGELLATVLKDVPLDEGIGAFCHLFDPPLPKTRLLHLLQRQQAGGPGAIEASSRFAREVQGITYSPGLDFVPGVAVYPHYGSPSQATLEILESLRELRPELMHVGLPNGTALVTTFGRDGIRLHSCGWHPYHRVTYIDLSGAIRTCVDADELPYPRLLLADRPRPPASSA